MGKIKDWSYFLLPAFMKWIKLETLAKLLTVACMRNSFL